MRINHRYMCIPINENATMKTVFLRDKEGKLLYELNARISDVPTHSMPYDLRDCIGQELVLSTQPEFAFEPILTDEPDATGLYDEPLRPLVHFSASRGWINDPNGFVFYEGQYHLFFQHNPVDTVWGNMHWGHAVSADLVHWTELEETLFPDENGAMFSGSAVIDTENRTGLKCCEHDPLLLFYTAAGGHGEMSHGKDSTQRLCYSVDGGKTFIKHPQVLIDTIAPGNRDPKVIYCKELGCYLMALYLEGREFALFTSENLLDWKKLQNVVISEDDECPDIYPLTLDGERFWVMTAAHDRYVVGKMEGGHFVPCAPTGRLHYGTKSYAAQTCFAAPDGRRIRFGWNQSHMPGMPFTGSMTTPHDLHIERIGERICLCAWPSIEFEALRRERRSGQDKLLLPRKANDILLSIPQGVQAELTICGLRLFADTMASKLTRLPDRRRPFESPAEERFALPLPMEDGKACLRIVQDAHSVEIYAGHGEATACLQHAADGLLNSVTCAGAEITAWGLCSMHQ